MLYWEPTRDTPIETVKFMLDLPPVQPKQKMEQVKAYPSAVENPHNTPNEAVKDSKRRGLGQGVLDGSGRGLTTTSRQNGIIDQDSRSPKQQTARPHSARLWLSHRRLIMVGLHY